MNHDEQDLPDARDAALDDRYRRASAAEAGRPSDATRAAILAHAAEQVRQSRRTVPAANDARLAWRAVAGVAVLGVAVLLWRETGWLPPGQPPTATVPNLTTEVAEPTGAAGSTPQPAVISAPSPATALPPPPAPTRTPAPVSAPASERAEALPAPPVLSASPPEAPRVAAPAAADSTAGASVASDESSRRLSQALARSAPAAAAREGAANTLQDAAVPPSRAAVLLRQQFPALVTRDVPATVWLALDGDGDVLRKGELPAGSTLDDQARRLKAEAVALRIGPWHTEVVVNDAGQPVTVAVTVAIAEPLR